MIFVFVTRVEYDLLGFIWCNIS